MCVKFEGSQLLKKIVFFSFPTLNVSVPEEVLEDPRLLFHLDPIIGEKHDGKLVKLNLKTFDLSL
jgi:hypothetical protein